MDDETSTTLLLGYACAGSELKAQLAAHGLTPSASCPLIVHVPCGVGGVPAGVCWGLKVAFGDAAAEHVGSLWWID